MERRPARDRVRRVRRSEPGNEFSFVVPLIIGGVEQGMKLRDAGVAFADANAVALKFLRISTTGQLLVLLGALLFAANILVMTIQWKLGVIKCVIAYLKSPLETSAASEVKS